MRKADTVEIGGNTLSNVTVSSINMSLNDTRFKQTIQQSDGLMGFDVFAGAIVNLSLSGKTMQITDPSSGPASAPPGAVPIGVDLTEFVPRVPANIDGKLPIMAMLDTGATSLVLISTQVEHHGVNIIANRSYGANAMLSGVGGEELSVCGPIARIAVGPFVYTNTEACESANWGLHEGLIGFDFLRHFDYVFDYPHGLLYMIPLNNS